MYLALNPSLTAGRVPWPEFAQLAAKIGYPGVDINLGRAMESGVEPTRALLKELNLKPAVINLPGDFRKDDETFKQSLKRVQEAAEFGAAVGCPRMTTYLLPSSETPKAELRKTLKDRFKIYADILARSHVRLGLEFVSPVHHRKRFPHEFIWRMDEMLAFANEIAPNVGLLLDVWHWHHAGATAKDIVSAGKKNIVHVHLSDAPNLPPEKILDSERLMPGEGVIDYAAFFGALKKIGYEDAVSPEVLGAHMKQRAPEEGARVAYDKSLAVMKKAGVA